LTVLDFKFFKAYCLYDITGPNFIEGSPKLKNFPV
jgi:hypothetical protein